MAKRWIIEPDWPERDAAARRWSVPPVVAHLLHVRGVTLDQDVRAFLSPSLTQLHPPSSLPGAIAAAAFIVDAVRAKQRILIYGDYDVDGIMGTAILWHTLRLAGADVRFYVPHRIEEGYGLNVEAVEGAVRDGAELIISVDCGINAVEAASALRARSVPLVITDHHTVTDPLPDAEHVVHPGLGADPVNRDLCGAGVAFKLAWAIAQRFEGHERVGPEFRALLKTLVPLAALGTIADVVPLSGENRIIAKCGLADLPATPLDGLRALMDSAGLTRGTVDGYDVGFKLAPRLNAAGRMGHARLAVEMMTRADAARSREIATYLEKQNRARQAVERDIAEQARGMIDATGMAGDARRGIVVASEDWHPGVIGIVASRLVERYGRPAVVISTRDGRGQGSGRGIRNFDLNGALAACAEHLESFGGHRMAAGLRIDPPRIEAFRDAFVAVANQRLTPRDITPAVRLDAEVRISELDLRTVLAIGAIGPFGAGNPRPRFATDTLDLAAEPRGVGAQQAHVQAVFAQDGATIKAIGFGMAPLLESLKTHRRCKVAFEPIINEFNGRRTVEMKLVDLKFPEGSSRPRSDA